MKCTRPGASTGTTERADELALHCHALNTRIGYNEMYINLQDFSAKFRVRCHIRNKMTRQAPTDNRYEKHKNLIATFIRWLICCRHPKSTHNTLFHSQYFLQINSVCPCCHHEGFSETIRSADKNVPGSAHLFRLASSCLNSPDAILEYFGDSKRRRGGSKTRSYEGHKKPAARDKRQ